MEWIVPLTPGLARHIKDVFDAGMPCEHRFKVESAEKDGRFYITVSLCGKVLTASEIQEHFDVTEVLLRGIAIRYEQRMKTQ